MTTYSCQLTSYTTRKFLLLPNRPPPPPCRCSFTRTVTIIFIARDSHQKRRKKEDDKEEEEEEAIFAVIVRKLRTFKLFDTELTEAGICCSYITKEVMDGIPEIFPCYNTKP